MLIAHISDLHLRDAGDITWLERQLATVAARNPVHLAVTGDLLDRWDPELLERALDAFAAHGFLDTERLTLFHGNHDFASSGGHPRGGADIFRMVLHFWDPPPLVRRRQRRFYAAVASRASDVAVCGPSLKMLRVGLRLAVIETVPVPWSPIRLSGRSIIVRHGIGRIRASETKWLAGLRGPSPLIVLTHHYPLETEPFTWTPDRPDFKSGFAGILGRVVKQVRVPMHIVRRSRKRFWKAASAAGARFVLCGHVHRARLEWHEGIAVGLNGQSGAEWAGRTVAFYAIDDTSVRMELLRTSGLHDFGASGLRQEDLTARGPESPKA